VGRAREIDGVVMGAGAESNTRRCYLIINAQSTMLVYIIIRAK